MRLPIAIALLASTASLNGALAAPPASAKKPVTDTYHGTSVTDDYRWLEDWNNAEVKTWSEAQNAHARSVLDKLPKVEPIRKRLTEIMSAPTVFFGGLTIIGDNLFAIRSRPPKQHSELVVMPGADQPDKARILVDPDTLDPKHLTTIDWYRVSPDGTLVAVSLSSAGTESGDVHVYSVASGKEVFEVVPRVNGGTAGGDLAWSKDGKGFFYTRYPREGERPSEDMDFYTQVYFHTLGTSTSKDRYETGAAITDKTRTFTPYEKPDAPKWESAEGVLGGASTSHEVEMAVTEYRNHLAKMKMKHEEPKGFVDRFGKAIGDAVVVTTIARGAIFEFPRIAEINLTTDPNSKRLLTTVQYGDGNTFALYLRDEEGYWSRIADYSDKIVQGRFGPDSCLYLISLDKAPKGKVFRLKKDATSLAQAETLIAESDASIVSEFGGSPSIVSTPTLLFVEYQTGGPQEIRVFTHDGKRLDGPKFAPVSDNGAVTADSSAKPSSVLFYTGSYTTPGAWMKYELETGKTTPTALKIESPVDFSPYEVVRELAKSKDGTKVPVNIVMKKGTKLDGSHPCLVTAYGGYGVNISPGFRAVRAVLLEQGVIWAQANIRGGGEYGEEWHRQGNLTKKQNVFDDFAAVCQYMIDAKYTTPGRLAIEGGSNGGLLMGAAMTQHPDLFKCVVSHVGIYDMLRVELSSNGAFNIPEFGTVKDKAQFDALHAYSPYHHVKDGTKYPPVLFLTGANDPRVDPMQSRKMTARLQAVGAKALLRTSGNSGHGGGTPLTERIEQAVDVHAFLFHELGVDYKAVN